MKSLLSLKVVLSAATVVFLSSEALAGDVAAGKAKAGMCGACHGAAGIASVGIYPNLAGQNAPYLVSAIKAYKDKNRSGGQAPMMYGMVAALSDADIDNIAAYYSSLK